MSKSFVASLHRRIYVLSTIIVRKVIQIGEILIKSLFLQATVF